MNRLTNYKKSKDDTSLNDALNRLKTKYSHRDIQENKQFFEIVPDKDKNNEKFLPGAESVKQFESYFLKREKRKSLENLETINEISGNSQNFINYLKNIGVIDQFTGESTFLQVMEGTKKQYTLYM